MSNVEMPSEVTRKYFEDWDDLHIKAPFQLKEAVKEKILEAENNGLKVYREFSNIMDISVEDLKSRLQIQVERLIEGSDGIIGIYSENGYQKAPFRMVCESGRFKSIFESRFIKNGYSHNDLIRYLSKRAYAEYDAIKFPVSINENIELRPIYGYVSSNILQYNPFGSITCKIKRPKLNESAILFRNLGRCPEVSPFVKPHFTLFNQLLHLGGAMEYTISSLINSMSINSIRILNTNQLSLSDIESIHVVKDDGHLIDIGEVRAPGYRVVQKSLNQKMQNIKDQLKFYEEWSGINIPLFVYDENFNLIDNVR